MDGTQAQAQVQAQGQVQALVQAHAHEQLLVQEQAQVQEEEQAQAKGKTGRPAGNHSKSLTPGMRDRICELHSIGWGYKAIHRKHPQIPVSTIRYTIKMEPLRKENASLPRSGRPRTRHLDGDDAKPRKRTPRKVNNKAAAAAAAHSMSPIVVDDSNSAVDSAMGMDESDTTPLEGSREVSAPIVFGDSSKMAADSTIRLSNNDEGDANHGRPSREHLFQMQHAARVLGSGDNNEGALRASAEGQPGNVEDRSIQRPIADNGLPPAPAPQAQRCLVCPHCGHGVPPAGVRAPARVEYRDVGVDP
ncbi:hypothetical protein PG990_013808 [Apiospora arundinis]